MISPEKFYHALSEQEIDYFAGVPDSLLKQFCGYVSDNSPEGMHTIAANEGGAVGLAIGYYLATGKLPLVYMQNSGFGNTCNPLLSLVDKDIYGIPMILMIGWRGEPGVKDEPQHVKQGRISEELLNVQGIPYTIVDGSEKSISQLIETAKKSAIDSQGAHALLIKKNTFENYTPKEDPVYERYGWKREDAIKTVIDHLEARDIVISTTGMASREVFEYREDRGEGHQSDFLTVGGMGHASQIALGVASQKINRRVVCIDGDGAALMHLGSLAISGTSNQGNFRHIIINNGAHDSVGGQPTVCFEVNLPQIAKACGYKVVTCCDNAVELPAFIDQMFEAEGPSFLEIRVDRGNRKDLGRPTTTPKENKEAFMSFLK